MNVNRTLCSLRAAALILLFLGGTGVADSVDFDAVKSSGRAQATKPGIAIRPKSGGAIVMDVAGRSTSNICVIEQSDDLVHWTPLRELPAGEAAGQYDLLTSEEREAAAQEFFRITAAGALTDELHAGDRPAFSIRSKPPGGMTGAKLNFSTDGGLTWIDAAMNLIGTDGLGDIWGLELPLGLGAGSKLSYTFTLTDQDGLGVSADNGGGFYTANVVSPGQTDTAAPSASHSPSATTVTNASLQVALSATDNADPAPVIRYTTDGSIPTAASLIYSNAITVTNTGVGVDMTIRYFATDSSGNDSGVKCAKVRVAQPDAVTRSIKDVRVLSPDWVCAVVDPTEEILAARGQQFGPALSADKAQYLADVAAGKPNWYFAFSKNYHTLVLQNSYHLPLFAKFNEADFWRVNRQAPQDITMWSHSVDGFPGWDTNSVATPDFTLYCRTADMIYLKLPKPLQSGEPLEVAGEDGRSRTLAFSENSTPCWSIKVNQSAYSVTAAKKVAYLGMWLPGIGGVDFSALEGMPFYLKRYEKGARWDQGAATGAPVFTGTIALRKRFADQNVSIAGGSNLTGEDVYELDFSAFSAEGTYCLQIPGLGRSWPFEVTSGGYGAAFYTMMKGLYTQRCGTALTRPFIAWERPACHTETKQGQFIPESNNWYTINYRKGATNQNSVGFRNAAGTRIGLSQFTLIENSATNSPVMPEVKGGWHDAADFDRRINHYDAIWDLLAAAEAFPAHFTDSQLNIPESGNGIPDILDEVAYGLDVWKSTQRADGAVSSWIEQESHPGAVEGGLQAAFVQNQKTMYASVPDRSGSYAYANAAACLGRLLAGISPARSQEYIESAARAYAWAKDPGHAMTGVEFAIVKSAKDSALTNSIVRFDEDPVMTAADTGFVDGALAAANLYFATGEAAYLNDWNSNSSVVSQKYVLDTSTPSIKSTRCVPLLLNTGLPTPEVSAMKSALLASADSLVTNQAANPYRMLWHSTTNRYFSSMGWGAIYHYHTRVLAAAYAVTRDARYRSALENAADFFLGCNPLGATMVTGIGSVYPIALQHIHSLTDGIPDPTPGIAPYSLTWDITGNAMKPYLIADKGHVSVSNYYTPVGIAFVPDKLGRKQLQADLDAVPKILNDDKWIFGATALAANNMRNVVWANFPVLRRKTTHPSEVTWQNEFTVGETISPLALLFGALTADAWMPPDELKNRQPRQSADDIPLYSMP